MSFSIAEIIIYFDGPFDIVDKFRKFAQWISPGFGKMISCFACLSTWIGLIFSAINYWFVPIRFTPFNIILGDTHMWWLIIFCDSMFTCGTTWMLHQLEELMERVGEIKYEDEEE